MNLVEYKKIALQRLNKTIADNDNESMYYGCMGLIEETGEIISELRKPLFKGNFHEKTLDIYNIKSELGDLIWYVTLLCKQYNIDIEKIEKVNSNEENIQLPRREEIIRIAISMGESTGQIVKECVDMKNGNRSNEKLINRMSDQYKNINKLAKLLEITIEQILDENVKKINSRYNEKGDINR